MCCLAPKDLRFRCRSAGVYTELKYLSFWTAGEDPTVLFCPGWHKHFWGKLFDEKFDDQESF